MIQASPIHLVVNRLNHQTVTNNILIGETRFISKNELYNFISCDGLFLNTYSDIWCDDIIIANIFIYHTNYIKIRSFDDLALQPDLQYNIRNDQTLNPSWNTNYGKLLNDVINDGDKSMNVSKLINRLVEVLDT